MLPAIDNPCPVTSHRQRGGFDTADSLVEDVCHPALSDADLAGSLSAKSVHGYARKGSNPANEPDEGRPRPN
jgi:hypothetical protein